MAYKIQKTETIQQLREAARLSISEGFPQELAQQIVPVIEVNPKLLDFPNNFGAAATGTSNAGVTALTTSSVKETYITSLTFHLLKDATCDAATGSLTVNATANGATINLANIQHITLTAADRFLTLSYPVPIRVDKGSTIRSTNLTFTVGVCRVALTVQVIERDP